LGSRSSAGIWLTSTRVDPVGRLLFDALAMVAEFEADLVELHPAGEHTSGELAEPAMRLAEAMRAHDVLVVF
jgi:hypothetical protein